MYIIQSEDLNNMQVITADARILGTIADVRYDHKNWNVSHFRVNLAKGLEREMATGKFRGHFAKLLIPIDSVDRASEVVLLTCNTGCVKDVVIPDSDNIPLLSSLIGKKVVTSENVNVGKVETLTIDLDENWLVTGMKVRVDKTMVDSLGLKKSLFGRPPAINVKTLDVNVVGDMAFMSRTLEELKKEVAVYE